MLNSTLSQDERTEMQLVLDSGLFEKAPRLGRFFRYICERHLNGESDQIKEYTIAVEALDRSAEFDPKKDSIVRVEAHRLRKRLEEYYRGPGACHGLQITVPNGQYRPQFVVRAVEANSAPAAGHRDPAPVKMTNVRETPSAEARFSRPRFRYIVGAAVLAGAIVVPVAWVRVAPRTHSSSASASETWVGSTTAPIPQEVRVLTGYHGGPVTDDEGHSWTPDAYYAGGISKAIPPEHFIEAEAHPHLLKAQRSGQFRYDIPLQPGNYELHLYFAETEYGRGNLGGGGEGTRMFQVSINGLLRLRELDPLAEAGAPNRMHERVFKDIAPASDGKLHLSFDPANAPAFLNAIEILPSPPGRIRPVRIVAQANALTDSQGHAWAADGYFCGGTPVFRQNFVISPPEKALYRGERYGNFSYHIPLAPGKYRLSLHFAEQWFGTAESGLPLRGSRIFNVFANGVTLLRNFQIVEDAGGPNRGVTKVFNNLEPNAQGMLLLDFVPVKNYAEVNAIEVVENE